MGQSVTQAPNRFVYLDFLRFAFAMVVFFGHAKAYLALPKAELAVDYFFILSGFVLTHAYKDRVLAPQFLASFIRDRVARLYPLHLATLAVLVFFNIWFLEVTNGQWLEQGWSYQDGRTYTLSLSLLLLNNVGLTPSGPSWNAPAWSISVELWVNILLAVLAVVSRRHFIRLCAAAFLGCYLILFVYVGALGDFYRNIGPPEYRNSSRTGRHVCGNYLLCSVQGLAARPAGKNNGHCDCSGPRSSSVLAHRRGYRLQAFGFPDRTRKRRDRNRCRARGNPSPRNEI